MAKLLACPVSILGFNPRRFLIGETNPNNFTTGHVLDTAGQEVQLVLADGTTSRTQVFGALTRVMWYLDARTKRWEQSWTGNNQISQLLSPQKYATLYSYNEMQGRNLTQDAEGHKRYYTYSATDFIESHYEPGGQGTRYVRSRTGNELEVYNPDDTRLFWKRDFYGVPSEHTDAGGAVITYSENFRRQRTHQTSAGGSHGGTYKRHRSLMPRQEGTLQNQNLCLSPTKISLLLTVLISCSAPMISLRKYAVITITPQAIFAFQPRFIKAMSSPARKPVRLMNSDVFLFVLTPKSLR